MKKKPQITILHWQHSKWTTSTPWKKSGLTQRLAYHRNSPSKNQLTKRRRPSTRCFLMKYWTTRTFDKQMAEHFPELQPWDHAIDLKEDFVPKDCKIYLLSPPEQIELDKFIDENCKGTLLSTHFSDGISPPHDSRYILSMQCPTTSPVNHLLLIQLLLHLRPIDSLTETQKHTPKISAPYSIVYHCCTCHHCCVTTIFLLSIAPSCI